MKPVFRDFKVVSPDGEQILFELKCDNSRFPFNEAVDEFVGCLKRAGKLLDLPHHDLTGRPIPIDDFTVCIWSNTYVAKLPTWTGVTTLASDVSKAEVYQYVTVAGDNNDALVFDTYERAVELAKLAASIVGSDSPRGMIVAAPPALHGACTRFMEIVENTALHQTQQRGA